MASIKGPVLLGVLPLILVGCGDTRADPDPDGTEAGATGQWAEQSLAADVGADQAPLLETSGDEALVVTVSEDGTLLSHRSTEDGRFEAGTPLETEETFLRLGGAVRLPDGRWFALGSGGSYQRDGDEELAYETIGFVSADGLAWERVDVTGFVAPAEVNDVAIVDGTIVVAGAYRLAEDPGMGGFEAHVWTSTDGTEFTELDLAGVRPPRGYRHESYAGQVVAAGDRMITSGRVDSSAAVWTSDDDGETWQQVSDEVLADTYSLSGLAAVGDVVVAGVGEGQTSALRSTDGGDSWAPVEALPVEGEEMGWAPVWADQQRFWTLTGVDDTSWSQPEVCYADLDQCGQDRGPQVVSSPDGAEWTTVEVPGEIDEIAGTADGRVLVMTGSASGPVVHTLAAGTSPPPATGPADPETVDLVTVEEGERPEVGVRYHAPMYVHCGMEWFWLGDSTWSRTDDGPDVESGAGEGAPEGWPLVGEVLYGYATLTDEDHLEYSFGDEVVATYLRVDKAPRCD